MICNEWFRDEFQSTLPVRGATMLIRRNLKSSGYFNPRSPYGERLHTNQVGVCTDYFNPRSPYGERPRIFTQTLDKKLFQSTLPVRGATTNPGIRERRQANFNPRSPYGERLLLRAITGRSAEISIHAPRTGSDKRMDIDRVAVRLFQSTLPVRGATRQINHSPWNTPQFQSTLPVRGAT